MLVTARRRRGRRGVLAGGALVAIEVLARVSWPAGGRWLAIRFGGLGPVALVAAVVSYRHLSGLLAFYGEDTITSTVGPLAVDGLMVMATGALLATQTRWRGDATGRRPGPSVRADTAPGHAATRCPRGPPGHGTDRSADTAGGHRRQGVRAAQRASGHGRGGHRRPVGRE